MVKNRLYRLTALCLLLALLGLGGRVQAAENLVNDLAASFTADQASQLEQDAKALGAQYGMDIVIVTTNDAEGKSSRAYADDFFDYQGYGVGDERDGILFLIDFDNREAYISTSGRGIRYLTDYRIESILDDVVGAGLADGDVYGATRAFLASTSAYLAAGIPEGQYNEPESNSLTVFEGFLSLAAAGLLGLGFSSTIRQSYKGKYQAGVFDFRKNSLLNLGIVQDNLVNTYTTSRIRPVQTSTSRSGSSIGRSSTHRSSSGRSHGGGGRRF